LFLACFLRFGATWSALVAALFGCLMIALALIDLEHFILPDRITLPGIALGLLVQPLVEWAGLRSALIGAAVGAGLILAMNAVWLALRGVQGFGLGDVKMLAMIGAFLGLQGMVVTLFLAALLGSITGLALMTRGRIHLQSRLPFGFFLSIGALAALFCGRGVVDWYLSFFP
jgi:leader peptidase (prepilin peptidase)/N-methyltransferase